MQEEVENRTLTLVVNGTKFTGRLFKAAICKYLAHRKEKKLNKQRSRDAPVKPQGKQTVKQLIGQNQGVSNIEITDPSIKEFEKIARKYGVDTLLLKGQMTHRATLGTDPRGNLTRIDNALAQMPQRLEAAKAQLDNLYQQQAAAKEEVGKPFLYEEELRSKNARLVELDTLLNIDGKGQAHTESVVAKSTRPSVLDNLKRPVQPRSTDKKPKQHEEVR